MLSWLLEKFLVISGVLKTALAQVRVGGIPPGETTFPNPLGSQTFGCLAETVLGKLILLAGPLVVIMLIYGAFQMLTSSGDPEKFSTGKKTILYAVIGFAIILISLGIANIVNNFLGGGELGRAC